MHSHPLRTGLVALAAAVLLPAAAASAKTFCVGVPGCSGTPELTLQDALTAAGGSTASANRIELGSGTWVGVNSAGAQPQGLEIVGAGTGLTILRSNVVDQPALSLTGPAESVTGLSIRLAALSGASPAGLLLRQGARADGIRATADSGVAGLPVQIDSGGQLSHSFVGSDVALGVAVTNYLSPGATTISDSDIHASPPIQQMSPATTTIARDRLTVTLASEAGLVAIEGDTVVRDTLVDLRGVTGGTGLVASSVNVANAALDARRVTILGDASSTAVEVHSDIVNGAASLSLADSVLRGVGIRALRDNAGTASVALDHVDTWPAVPDQLNGLVADDVASSYADPMLGPDLAPQPGSPLIDAAAPLTGADGTTDAAGTPRSVDGNGDCTAQPDIGAFEAPAVGCPAPPPGPTPVVSPAAAKDTTAPLVTNVRIAHRRAVRFTLSESANVTVRIRRAHHRALILERRGAVGHVTLKLRHRLRHGRYAIRVVAVDAAGNRSVRTVARAKA